MRDDAPAEQQRGGGAKAKAKAACALQGGGRALLPSHWTYIAVAVAILRGSRPLRSPPLSPVPKPEGRGEKRVVGITS